MKYDLPDSANSRTRFLLESYLRGNRLNYFTRLEAVLESNEELVIQKAMHTVYVVIAGASVYVLKSRYIWTDP